MTQPNPSLFEALATESQHIPKSFWHCLSLSLLMMTTGLTWVTIRSTDLTFKVADFELQNNRVKLQSHTQALQAKNQKLQEEIEDLRITYQAVAKDYQDLQTSIRQSTVAQTPAIAAQLTDLDQKVEEIHETTAAITVIETNLNENNAELDQLNEALKEELRSENPNKSDAT